MIVNNMRANVAVLLYDDHDRTVKILHSLDRTVWSGKVKAILESDKYEALTVDELFSKLKSSEVDHEVCAKIENPTDSHSLALVSGSMTNANMSSRQFSLSCLVSMPDEEFDMLGEEDLAFLSRRFERMYMNRKNARRSSGMCYRCGKHEHFIAVPGSHGGQARAQAPFEDRPQAPLEGRLQWQEQVRAEAKEGWWSQEEEASDGVRCKRHRLKLPLLFIELK
jgi:hypothetical protein